MSPPPAPLAPDTGAPPPAPGSDPSGLGDQIITLLPLLGRFLTQTLREQDGPSPERIRLLRQLDRGPIRAGELAHSCLLSPATVSELADSLVREGHVHREADPHDRRAVVLRMTPSGSRELHRVQQALTARIVERLEPLGADQRSRLAAALADLHASLRDLPPTTEVSRHGR